MDEVIIKGTKYISSKRAAKTSGYAKDYIGQLVRMGKVAAVKVGRSWFVDERGLLAHVQMAENKTLSVISETAKSTSPTQRSLSPYQISAAISFPKTWSDVKYYHDNDPLYPDVSDTRESLILRAEGSVSVPIRRISSRSTPVQAIPANSFDGIRVSVREIGSTESGIVDYVQQRARDAVKVEVQDTQPSIVRTLVAAIVVSIAALLMPIFG